MGKPYSEEFKKRAMDKLYSPNSLGIASLGREIGVPPSTISGWKHKLNMKISYNSSITNHWSLQSKIKAVLDTSKLEGEELGLWLRKNGVYSHDLELWKKEIIEMSEPKPDKNKEALKLALKENAQLKAELRRKDKALAEASALLVLKKKAQLIWGDEDD